MILTSVDLPAPFSPTSAWIEPGLEREGAGAEGDDGTERLRDVAQLQRGGRGGCGAVRHRSWTSPL